MSLWRSGCCHRFKDTEPCFLEVYCTGSSTEAHIRHFLYFTSWEGKGLLRRVKNTYFRNIPSSGLTEALVSLCLTSHIVDLEESLVEYHLDDDGYTSADDCSEPTARMLKRMFRLAQHIRGNFYFIFIKEARYLKIYINIYLLFNHPS